MLDGERIHPALMQTSYFEAPPSFALSGTFSRAAGEGFLERTVAWFNLSQAIRLPYQRQRMRQLGRFLTDQAGFAHALFDVMAG